MAMNYNMDADSETQHSYNDTSDGHKIPHINSFDDQVAKVSVEHLTNVLRKKSLKVVSPPKGKTECKKIPKLVKNDSAQNFGNHFIRIEVE